MIVLRNIMLSLVGKHSIHLYNINRMVEKEYHNMVYNFLHHLTKEETIEYAMSHDLVRKTMIRFTDDGRFIISYLFKSFLSEYMLGTDGISLQSNLTKGEADE